ncbi:MAG: 50S ribosomal protein L11 methyltransferase [bacterium]
MKGRESIASWLQTVVKKDELTENLYDSPYFTGSTELSPEKITLYFKNCEKAQKLLLSHSLSFEIIKDEEWEESWKKYFDVVSVDGFRIVPPWLKDKGDIVVNPGKGFGTGQHETTQKTLSAILSLLKKHKIESFADVGAGSGILSMAVHKKYPGTKITAWEKNEQAFTNMLDNLSLNSVSSVETIHGSPDINSKKHALVAANILSSVLFEMQDILKNISLQFLILSGIMSSERDSFFSRFDKKGFEISEQYCDNEWITFLLKRKYDSKKQR